MSAYDSKLLESARKATKEERQQGYDAALLLEKGETPPPLPQGAARPSQGALAPPTTGYGTGSSHGHSPRDPQPDVAYGKKMPFLKTRKGKIIVAVVVLLILAIIGGVVGGVVGSNKSKSSTAQSTAPQNGGDTSGAGSTSHADSVAGGSATIRTSEHDPFASTTGTLTNPFGRTSSGAVDNPTSSGSSPPPTRSPEPTLTDFSQGVGITTTGR